MAFRKPVALVPPNYLHGYTGLQFGAYTVFGTGTNALVNRVYIMPLWVPAPFSVKNIGSDMPGVGNFDVGVYSGVLPGGTLARLFSLGATANLPGDRTWTPASPWALSAGALWLAWVTDTAGTRPENFITAGKWAGRAFWFFDQASAVLPATMAPTEATAITFKPPHFTLNASAF